MAHGVQPIPAVTAEQMREVDRLMAETYGVSLLQMMELTGRALATFSRSYLIRLDPQGRTVPDGR